MIAAATETFRLSTVPSIGIPTGDTRGSSQPPDRPVASLPSTSATGPRMSTSVYGTAASTRAAIGRDSARRQPVQRGWSRRRRDRHAEYRAEARPNGVGVEQVREGIGGDQAAGTGSVGRPQDRPEVARLLDRLDDDDERLIGHRDKDSRLVESGTRTIATTPSDRLPNATFAMTSAIRGSAFVPAINSRRTASSASAVLTSSSQTNASTISMPLSSAAEQLTRRRR